MSVVIRNKLGKDIFAPFRLRTWLEGWRLPWTGFGLGSEEVRLLRERAASPKELMVRWLDRCCATGV